MAFVQSSEQKIKIVLDKIQEQREQWVIASDDFVRGLVNSGRCSAEKLAGLFALRNVTERAYVNSVLIAGSLLPDHQD